MSVPGVRWVLSPLDFRAHVLAEPADDPLGVWIARCGHGMPSAAGVDEAPRGTPCSACALAADPFPGGFDWFGAGP
ncbi:MAG: hypothetical protein ACRDT0_25875 [Pseudonocardiaceae bacterium]